MATIVPGIDEYLSKGIKQLGDTLSLFFDTDRKTQRAIRNMLVQNPKLVQDFADLEYKSPGSIDSLGFGGKISGMIRSVRPSMDAQREVRYGEQVLNAEEKKAGIEMFKNNLVFSEIKEHPEFSALEVGALVNGMFGIPRKQQLELEDFSVFEAQFNADRIDRLREFANQGKDVKGAISDYVTMYRSRNPAIRAKLTDDVLMQIIADPGLGPIFQGINDMMEKREQNEFNLDLAFARSRVGAAGAVTAREIDNAQDIRYSINVTRSLLADRPQGVGPRFWFPESVRNIGGELAGRLSSEWRAFLVDPEGAPLRQSVTSIRSNIIHLLSGTAVTANERKGLEPLTPNIFDPPDVIAKKLDGLDKFYTDYISRRSALRRSIESGVIKDPKDMIDEWIQEGLEPEEIRRRYDEELRKILESVDVRR